MVLKYGNKKTKQSVFFILGAPRTGSTIFYQYITNLYNVNYIDNIVNSCKENILVGFELSKLIYKDLPHNSSKSRYGNTDKLHAPSEGGAIWYRWFKKEAIDYDLNDISSKKLDIFKQNIKAIINKHNKPLVIKNLSFDLRIKLLIRTLENVKYIIIRRDPLFVAQSIYYARKNRGKDLDNWWSIKPSNYDKLKSKSFYEQIIGQIYFLEKQIFDNLETYDKDKVLVINYENLDKLLDKENLTILSDFMNAKKRDNDTLELEIKINNEIKLDKKDVEEFNKIIESYNWDFKHNFKTI